ncbi:CAF1_family ribonuclease [Hexamita inflata]|uniref:poly(A)-specific ribonuclease n=1 Tax=Hexamita inflata TaxID=28002 RepID=A0AA86RA78_9EUKA|nr:CAF1 family ribonuclease [Hexamita inflata]
MNIENVYAGNLALAFQRISQIIQRYNYISIDTEFPGYFKDSFELSKQLNKPLQSSTTFDVFKNNINNLKLIQFGIAFSDANGNSPKPAAFQFNFKFDIERDVIEPQSRSFLKESFNSSELERLKYEGICPVNFSNYFLQSGLVANANLKWFLFHGNQDIGYLIRALVFSDIVTQNELKERINRMFPLIYDIKTTFGWDFGLNALSQQEGVGREGTEHQAGSDALLTLRIAMKKKEWGECGIYWGNDM